MVSLFDILKNRMLTIVRDSLSVIMPTSTVSENGNLHRVLITRQGVCSLPLSKNYLIIFYIIYKILIINVLYGYFIFFNEEEY